jgi:hypothetical protein
MTLYSYITLPIPLGLWGYGREFHHISFVVSPLRHHPPVLEIQRCRQVGQRQFCEGQKGTFQKKSVHKKYKRYYDKISRGINRKKEGQIR